VHTVEKLPSSLIGSQGEAQCFFQSLKLNFNSFIQPRAGLPMDFCTMGKKISSNREILYDENFVSLCNHYVNGQSFMQLPEGFK
jgi:hypothetical protein